VTIELGQRVFRKTQNPGAKHNTVLISLSSVGCSGEQQFSTMCKSARRLNCSLGPTTSSDTVELDFWELYHRQGSLASVIKQPEGKAQYPNLYFSPG